MQFHVAQNGEKTGPFEREEVLRRLVAGEFKGSDLGWHEGLADWEPLSKLIPPPIPNPAAQPVFGPATASGTAPIVAAGSSGMALASMICGILGLLLWLPCIPAIILGHLSLSAIKKSAGALGGRGMAITGLITGYLMIAAIPIIAILASLAVPAFSAMQQKAIQAKTMSNAKQIVLGMRQYAAEHEGRLPPSLEKLVEDQFVDERLLAESATTPSANHYGQGWDYRGAGMKDTDAGASIVLVSLKGDRAKKKIVARLDGSVELVPESTVP